MVLEVQRLASETTEQSLLKEIQRTNNLGMHSQSKITCKNLTAYFLELYQKLFISQLSRKSCIQHG